MIRLRVLAASSVAMAMGAANGCAHTGAAGEPPNPPTVVRGDTEYIFEFVPPPGWLIPDAPVPSGALRVTVGGGPPSTAPASLMVRPVSKDGASLEQYSDAEFAAMAESFPGEALIDVPEAGPVGKRSVSRQITGPRRSATISIVDENDHFVWFGLIVNDPSYKVVAEQLFRESVRSYRRTPAHAWVEVSGDSRTWTPATLGNAR